MNHPPPVIPDYELVRRIGRGSYGEVWLARSVTGLYRAVKVIYRNQFEDDRPYEREFAGIKRFEPISRSNESQVDVLHVGRNDLAGYFYYVMELADDVSQGDSSSAFVADTYQPKTLKAVLILQGRLSVAGTLPIAISLAEALHHLHSYGLVHRDVKPSNIIFVNGRPKLADIGLIAHSDASRSFVGTEGFVPREGPGTPQADIFALGKVLYETSTGRDRLEFPSLPLDLEHIPDRLELGELNEVLLKACDPDPGLRYTSALELKNDLELIRAHRSVRRLRILERTVRRGRRLAVMAALAAFAVTIGWYQSHRFNRMAASQLAHVYVKNGQERLEQNDWFGALPWFSKALELETGLPDREHVHQLRIANMIEWCPQLTDLYTHSRPVRYAFFDADAGRALLCDPGSTAQVWETSTDQPISPPLQHGGQPFLGVFSPDGSRVATLSRGDGAARLWDAKTGVLINSPILHGPHTSALAFSPDGRWLATAGEDGCARLWNPEDGSGSSLRFVHGAPVGLLAFSKDGRRLLTAGWTNSQASFVCVWDLGTGLRMGSPLPASGPVSAADFRPDGNALVTGTATGEACLWELDAQPVLAWKQTFDHAVIRALFNRTGTRLLIASEWYAHLRDGRTGEQVGAPIPAYGTLRSAEFNPDGSRFILAGESRTALVYDSLTGRPQIPLIKHAGEIYNAFFLHHGGEWITASADNSVRRWRPSNGEKSCALFIHPRPVKSLLVTPDSRCVITVDDQGAIRQWPLTPGATDAQNTRKLNYPLSAVALTGDGRNLLLSSETNLSVVSSDDFRTVSSSVAPGGGIDRFVPSPRNPQAALRAKDGSIWLWNWHQGSLECLPLSSAGSATHMAFSADGSSLAVALDKTVITASISDSQSRITARIQHQDRVWHLGFGSEGQSLLVSSEDRILRWWNAATGLPITPPMRGDGGINFAEFSRDQQRVFTTSANYDAMIWNSITGQPITPPFKPGSGLTAAAFSPDNQWVLLSSKAALQVWDTSTGEAMTPPLTTAGPVGQGQFSLDGRWLVTLEGGTTVVGRPFLVNPVSRREALEKVALLSNYRVDDHGYLVPLSQAESSVLSRSILRPGTGSLR